MGDFSLISVILPCFNCEKSLPIAVESILNQKNVNLELILINNGSTDQTGSIIRTYKEKDERVISIYKPKANLVSALNYALDSAKSEFIARMDADDIAKQDRLSRQLKHLQNHPDTGLVSCCVEYSGDKEKNRGYYEYVKWTNTIITSKQISLSCFIESPFAHPTVMFRKSLVENYGGYLEAEDYELWLRFLEKGVRMEKIPEKLLVWNDSKNRLSRIDPRYSPEGFYRVKAKYLSNWLKKNNPYHPDVVIWGAGRTTRKRAEMLVEHGIRIKAYVDIDPKKIGKQYQGIKVISRDELTTNKDSFVIPYVSSRGARDEIRTFLNQQRCVPGKQYIFAA
jgi:glycosyltransferase involved in cell wall biosynthesis